MLPFECGEVVGEMAGSSSHSRSFHCLTRSAQSEPDVVPTHHGKIYTTPTSKYLKLHHRLQFTRATYLRKTKLVKHHHRRLTSTMTTFANPLTSPPGTPNTAYTLASFSGEIIYIPCSKSATRLLVTGKETENAFAVVGSGGSPSAPIGFHYHREAHDVFLCLKGAVNVWAGEKARRMEAGDFASVPPVSTV